MVAINELCKKYLVWCAIHKAPRSTEWYEGHIKQFLTHMGDKAGMDAEKMKAYILMEWVDSHPKWGTTYKRGGIVAIQRVLNWAVEMGHLETNPIRGLKKPPMGRRNNHMRPEDYQKFLAKVRLGDPFRDLLIFVWQSGCRPQEARRLEVRHVDLARECVIFPKEEAKGKLKPRVIYLHGDTLEIISRLMGKYNEGALFRNNRGGSWTKWALCNRMHRLSKMVGIKKAMYDARHGFATRKIIQGHDHLTIAALMGHSDGTMLAKVYSHIDKDEVFLKKALQD